MTQLNSLLPLLFLHLFIVSLEILPASELFKHYHLILSLFGSLLKQLPLLFFLTEIDDVGPPLLILLLEVLEELIEALVPLGHALDRLVEGLSWLALVLLHERLQGLNLANRAWTHYRLFLLRGCICEKEHL